MVLIALVLRFHVIEVKVGRLLFLRSAVIHERQ